MLPPLRSRFQSLTATRSPRTRHPAVVFLLNEIERTLPKNAQSEATVFFLYPNLYHDVSVFVPINGSHIQTEYSSQLLAVRIVLTVTLLLRLTFEYFLVSFQSLRVVLFVISVWCQLDADADTARYRSD